MKALVYKGPGFKAVEDRPVPQIAAPTDAIVRITKTTICGTDLHILKGDVPTCAPGRILGHEGVGIVEKTGPGVTVFKPGDRVVISCISSCGNASTAAGDLPLHDGRLDPAMRSTALRPNMSASPMPIRASTRFPRAPTKRRW